VHHVAQEVLAASCVVEAYRRGPDQRGSAEDEQVVGGVVQQDADVEGTGVRAQAGEQAGPALALR